MNPTRPGQRTDLRLQIRDAGRRWGAGRDTDAVAAEAVAAMTGVLRAQRLYVQVTERLLRPFELNASRLEVLTILYFSSKGALPLGVVARQLQLQPPSLTNTVDKLERSGYVVREPSDHDRRLTLVRITPKGRRSMGQAIELMNSTIFGATGLTGRELKQLTERVADLCVALAAVDHEDVLPPVEA